MSRADSSADGTAAYHDVESLPRDELRELQHERLRDTLEHVYENVPFYRERFDEASIVPSDIESIEDISTLPFTTKEDLRDQYPRGLFSVDPAEVRRIHASSGTTGKPKIVPYTEHDVEVWREVMARSLYAAGMRPGEVLQNSYGYGLFTGGMGFHEGGEALETMVIPVGGGNTGRQIDMLVDLESDTMGCTPSYCLYLAERIEERGIDPSDLALDRVIIGAEPFTDPMRRAIEDALDVTAIDIYGLSELIGPGVSVECEQEQDGLHVWEDHFYPEVVDPDTGELLEPGERGELVLTSLTKEGQPAIRYRTGDVTRLLEEPCGCGRTSRRMDNISGRVDDLLIVRGVNVYASTIEEVMLDLDAVAPHYRIDLDREDHLDTMEITVEYDPEADVSSKELATLVEERLNDVLDFTVDEVTVVAPGEIKRTTAGKVQRVYDHR